VADKQDRRAFFRELGRYGALGFEMSLSVVIGAGIGYVLDWAMERYLGLATRPWLMILWIGFGFAAGVRSLYRAALRSEKDLEKNEEEKRKPGGG
jgi:F0F1-type ATP synthase assembly protein I